MSRSGLPPNILVITADQWRGDCIGSLKTEHPVMTPHLNQLTEEGVTYTRAYADCPVCMPQRATFLTGKSGLRLGVTDNFHHPTPVGEDSLPRRLSREAGYQTQGIGKMHFHPDRARLGFDHVALHPNDYTMFLTDNGYDGLYRGHGLGGNEYYPTSSAVPERFTHTRWICEEAVRFLQRRDPQAPFFLWMVFEAPHAPFDPPPPYDSLYSAFEIPSVRSAEWEGNFPPYLLNKQLTGSFDQLTPQVIRETRRRYYGQISHIDYTLGRVLGELKSRGLYDDTLIIFTSDHGEHLGDYGLFGKHSYLSGSADVPLILKSPQEIGGTPGSRITSPVTTADIYPTILEAVGLDVDYDQLDGRNLFRSAQIGLAEQAGQRVIIGEVGDGWGSACIIEDDWKYIYYPNGGVGQLFQEGDDPSNLTNLAHRDDQQERVRHLRALLADKLLQHGRPMVDSKGHLKSCENSEPDSNLRARNNCAWRGPMHFGQGYGGGW